MESIFFILFYPLVIFGPIIFSWVAGNMYQNGKLKSAEDRTNTFLNHHKKDIVSNLKNPFPETTIQTSGLVIANISIGPSWWQMTAGGIKSIFGGKLGTYERVMHLGRMEVMQRLREEAIRQGWDEVINVRLDTATVKSNQNGKNKSSAFEIFAYGTGIKKNQ
ncbi:MAG: hypothetical protein CMA25_06265 [Euryarchaeota archaeon]|nr:hypothetical protein [Euryarchaeota archaeon]